MSEPATPADAGLQSSGPALCDTAHQSPASAAGVLQSACERRGRAVRGWPLLGRRGRTGVQEGLSVRRGPDVDPLLLTWDQAGGQGRRLETGHSLWARAGARAEHLGWGTSKVLWGQKGSWYLLSTHDLSRVWSS